MKQIYTPDLRVRLRHGGILDLSVCRADKVELLRSITHSLKLDQQTKKRLIDLISEIEFDSNSVDIWKLKLDSVQPEQCTACGNARLWGMGKGRFRLCDEHNSWYVYLKLRCKK